MTNEEMQKAMEFIVEQQAQSSAKIDALAETPEERIRALLSKVIKRYTRKGRNGKQ